MKKESVVFLFMLFILHSQGQDLLQEGKLWSNTSIGTMPGSTYASYFIKFTGDTAINGLDYKKVMKSHDALHSKWILDGCIREEPTTRKVYIFNGYTGKDMLLYDFSLETGDSIPIDDGHFYLKVTNVIDASFGNSTITRKQIYFFDPNAGPQWIEGIGSTWGVLEGLGSFYTTGATTSLVCYFENEQIQYHNPVFSNCFPNGIYNHIDVVPQKQSPVVVNYERDGIMFTFNKTNNFNSVLQLFNLNGEKVLEKRLAGANSFVLLENKISSGIYIYHYKNNGLTSSDKILIK